MQTLYVPKYNLHYRVNPKDPCELQWSRKPFGPMTQWQHAMSFKKPIRALDLDDKTKQGVVVLNDSSTYVGSGVRTWGRKFYPSGTRIYSLYAIGESKMKSKMKIRVHEKNRTRRYRICWKWKDGSVDGSYDETRKDLNATIQYMLENKDKYDYFYWEPVDKYDDATGPEVFVIGDKSMT